MKNKSQITCLSVECPERKSVCCDAKPYMHNTLAIKLGKPMIACSKCWKEFQGGKCTAEQKVKDWWEEHNWRKELEDLLKEYGNSQWSDYYNEKTDRNISEKDIEQFVETLLIKILSKCESAKDARECRHIIKDYLLKQ